MPSLNPAGRRGHRPFDPAQSLREIFETREWREFKRDVEKTTKLLVECMAKQMGATPKAMRRQLQERGLL